MRLRLRITNVFRLLLARIHTLLHAKTVQQPVERVREHKGGRPPVHFDVNEAARLHGMGWSDRKIARKFEVAPSTVGLRLRDYKPPVAPPIAPVQQSRPVYRTAASPMEPKPAHVAVEPVVSPPEPFGLAGIEPGTKEFLLVHGQTNVSYATGYDQRAVGIETWHPEYANLPVFRDVERVWVVVTKTEDNRAFIPSIASDLMIREKCVISTEGVQSVCKSRLQMICARRLKCETEEQLCRGFEERHRFQPIPLPTHTDKLAALAARMPEPDKASPFGASAPEPPLGGFLNDEAWRVGGSGASSACRSSGTPIVVPKRDPNDPNGGNGNDGSGFAF